MPEATTKVITASTFVSGLPITRRKGAYLVRLAVGLAYVMSDPVLDDPGELIRFWLWHERHHTVRSFKVANLAKALEAKPATVSAWLTRPLAVPSTYWNAIARFFGKAAYRELEDEAVTLWRDAANRRDYIPLHQVQIKRGQMARAATASPSAAGARVHPETPLAAAAIADSFAADARRAPRRRVARRAPIRKRHGTSRGA